MSVSLPLVMVPVLHRGCEKKRLRFNLKQTKQNKFTDSPFPGGYLSWKEMHVGDQKKVFILALFSFKPFKAWSDASAATTQLEGAEQ